MIELSRHIESLMLKHDCVIVPGLGGFVTQYVPARRINDEQLFLPPYRSVGFNRQLTLNDGLLVQSYMQAYDTNYPETIKLIEDAVRRLKETLQTEGTYELSGIGTLTLGIDGRYNFAPCDAGVLSPELYGLDSLMLPEVSAIEKKQQKTEAIRPAGNKKKVLVKRTERDYTISISREFVNYAAAAVVAIFFYFLWATPITNTETANQQAASAIYEQIFEKVSEKAQSNQATKTFAQPQSGATPIMPVHFAAEPTEKAASSETKAEEPTAKIQTETPAKPTVGGGRYTIVLASAIPLRNAEEFAGNLKSKGILGATTYQRGRMVRVVYGNYSSEPEAAKALTALRQHDECSDAWILEMK